MHNNKKGGGVYWWYWNELNYISTRIKSVKQRLWEWHTTEGNVTLESRSTGWPGLFTSTLQLFTFTADEFGAGSWHVNLGDSNFDGPGGYTLSVWINLGKTILISDNFTVVVE